MNSFVGIFWGIPGPDRSWIILTDTTSLAEAEPYGDFLTHPRGHYDVWSKWQKQSAAELSRQVCPRRSRITSMKIFPEDASSTISKRAVLSSMLIGACNFLT